MDLFSQKNDIYQEKLICVSRNAKVVKGGRVFGFSALTVVGDGNGKVGVGRGKAKEVPIAIQKAMENARKNFIYIELNNGTLFHKVVAKHCSSKVIILPSRIGTGIIAGNVMRSVFEVIGIKDVLAKCIGSTNANNVVLATLKGLINMNSYNSVKLKRRK